MHILVWIMLICKALFGVSVAAAGFVTINERDMLEYHRDLWHTGCALTGTVACGVAYFTLTHIVHQPQESYMWGGGIALCMLYIFNKVKFTPSGQG
jgi:hypothetical protein